MAPRGRATKARQRFDAQQWRNGWRNKERTARITDFQACVYAACAAIPRGTVSTYREVAMAAALLRDGTPRTTGARAAGQALRRNPLDPMVPCHRVVASDGRLTGFGGQTEGEKMKVKRAMLEEEGVGSTEDGRVVASVRRMEGHELADRALRPDEGGGDGIIQE